MQKNVASQKWVVFAFQDEGGTNPGEPVTGDAANITANLRIDGGAANAVDDLNPTELEDGYYIFDITAAESNGENIVICPASATANVNVIGVPGAVWTTPANFPDLGIASDGDLSGNVDGSVASISGVTFPTNFADMSITATSGRVDVGAWLGTAVTTSATSAKPEVDMFSISDSAAAANNLELSAKNIVPGTVDNSAHTPTTTEFEADDITEATADHFIGRIILFTSGALLYQATDITDYALNGANGHFTVTALTEAPANDSTFIII